MHFNFAAYSFLGNSHNKSTQLGKLNLCLLAVYQIIKFVIPMFPLFKCWLFRFPLNYNIKGA